MGLLDQLVGAVASGQSGGNNALLETVMKMLNDPQNGGLQGLIQSFQQGGLGDIVNSWVFRARICRFQPSRFKAYWVALRYPALPPNLVSVRNKPPAAWPRCYRN